VTDEKAADEAATAPSKGVAVRARVIREDDCNCLYEDETIPTDYDLDSRILLDDPALWEAYIAACAVANEASDRVRELKIQVEANLRVPQRTEIKGPPTPTTDELSALACLYVKRRLSVPMKPDPGIVALAAARFQEGSPPEGEKLFQVNWQETVPLAVIEALRAKDWISRYHTLPTGEELFSVTDRGWTHLSAHCSRR